MLCVYNTSAWLCVEYNDNYSLIFGKYYNLTRDPEDLEKRRIKLQQSHKTYTFARHMIIRNSA